MNFTSDLPKPRPTATKSSSGVWRSKLIGGSTPYECGAICTKSTGWSFDVYLQLSSTGWQLMSERAVDEAQVDCSELHFTSMALCGVLSVLHVGGFTMVYLQ